MGAICCKKGTGSTGDDYGSENNHSDNELSQNQPQQRQNQNHNNKKPPTTIQNTTQQNQRKKPPPPPPATRSNIVVSLKAYERRSDTELSFEKNTRFEVLDENNEEWWWMRNLTSEEVGYVIASYVVPASSLLLQEWFFGDIGRKEADKLLMSPKLSVGTYLVRNTKRTDKNAISRGEPVHAFSLSYKKEDSNHGLNVTHSRILQQGDRFFVKNDTAHSTLVDLISYYVDTPNSLVKLTKICPRPEFKANQPRVLTQTHVDKWDIDRDTVSFDKLLGEGNFGQVWKGHWNNIVEVAVKTMKPGSMTVEDFLKEAAIMKKLSHPNILILYAVCTTEEPLLIITEFMNKGSLLDVLREDGETFEFSDLVEICAQIAAGMEYVEGLGIIHRDLAARNILLDEEKLCKIADFGLARSTGGGEYSITNVGHFPVRWTAPEAITFNKYTIRSDVWSFSILMMEVLNLGATPYAGYNNQEVVTQVKTGMRMSRPDICPPELFVKIQMCWQYDPEKRPTFEFISSFLSDYAAASDPDYGEVGDLV